MCYKPTNLNKACASYILTVDYIKSKEIKLALGSENLDIISDQIKQKILSLLGQPQLLFTHDDTLASTRSLDLTCIVSPSFMSFFTTSAS